MTKFKKCLLISGILIGVVVLSAIAVSAASNLMDARLSGNFHWAPILNDNMEALTYYGTNQYAGTAACNVVVRAYNGNGQYNSSATIYRYGWDAVSGEGSQGYCKASASIRACHRGQSTHQGRRSSSYSWETTTLTVWNPYVYN